MVTLTLNDERIIKIFFKKFSTLVKVVLNKKKRRIQPNKFKLPGNTSCWMECRTVFRCPEAEIIEEKKLN